ncbi:MAG: LacI family DNA-binding transcriptional regulator [Streptosporangiales bacterium]|nr:LacI family DNA-binding transcriptional regulator [Streptosporangiales bacterium]
MRITEVVMDSEQARRPQRRGRARARQDAAAPASDATPAPQSHQGARARQADIARAAGVSQATVSLVLSDAEAGERRVGEATRRRVLEVAQQLGYSVNPAARSLAGGRNRLLGVYTFEAIFPSRDRDFYNPFLVTIEQEAERAAYDLLLFTSATLPDQRRRSIYAGGVNRLALADGCVLLGRRENQEEVARLAREGFPFVYVGRREIPDCEFAYVAADYASATTRVVSHLVELGHRSIVYLGAYKPKAPDSDREDGWHAAVRQAGLGQDDARLLRLGRRREIEKVVAQLRAEGRTALVLEDPELAERYFGVIAGMGLDVPGDISVAVLGDVPSPGGSSSGWNGFRIPREEMARQAVRLLLEAIETPPPRPRNITVPCSYSAGTTVDRPPRAARRRTSTRGRSR